MSSQGKRARSTAGAVRQEVDHRSKDSCECAAAGVTPRLWKRDAKHSHFRDALARTSGSVAPLEAKGLARHARAFLFVRLHHGPVSRSALGVLKRKINVSAGQIVPGHGIHGLDWWAWGRKISGQCWPPGFRH